MYALLRCRGAATVRSPRNALPMNDPSPVQPVRTIGRYALFDEIAAGGMATVHLGRLMGPVGFSRTVAIKRLHSHFAKDPDFSAGFVDEARLVARIHHPNVVPMIDVLTDDGELSLVMEYVEGDSLARLLRTTSALSDDIPLAVISAIVCGTLYGLHAAHDAVDEQGRPLDIVHRDVSPQNILVGTDGVPRLVDFGVAKAAQRIVTTADGQVKGKLAYMAPEQIKQGNVTRQTDVYAAGVVLWELICGKRLFQADNPGHLMSKVLGQAPLAPSEHRKNLPPELDQIVEKALARNTQDRYATARDMAHDLQQLIAPAPPTEVGDWVFGLIPDGITERKRLRAAIESQELSQEPSGYIAGLAIGSATSSPSEDLLTIANNASPTHFGHGQTLPGSTEPLHKEHTGLVIPLVVGLACVAGAIALLLASNAPVLTLPASSDEAAGIVAQSGPENSDRLSSTQLAARSEQDQGGPAAKAGDDHAADAVVEAGATGPSAVSPVAQPKLGASSCPKFYVDGEGIRRVNRKCWK